MKIIATLFIAFLSMTLTAQSPYEKAMQKGMELMKSDLQAAAQQFERVAKAESDNWLPPYYAAFCQINKSWKMKDKEEIINTLNKAQEFIDAASSNSKENPEIMVLQGMINTRWIQYDSSSYGMKLAGPTTAIYDKALQLAPDNPRVVSNRTQWLMGTAKFFGKDITPYCGEIYKAIALFEKETPQGFEPRWGKQGAVETQKGCKQ